MLNNFVKMTYGEARHEVLKELDNRGPIGSFLLSRHPDLTNIIEYVCRYLEKAMTPDSDPKDLGNFPSNIKTSLEFLTLRFPSYLILYSEHDWNCFCSALFLLLDNFLNAGETFINSVAEDDWSKEEKKYINRIREQLSAILRIIDIGAGYSELCKASAQIVEELKTWSQSRPAAFKLSEAYLKSLGIGGTEE